VGEALRAYPGHIEVHGRGFRVSIRSNGKRHRYKLREVSREEAEEFARSKFRELQAVRRRRLSDIQRLEESDLRGMAATSLPLGAKKRFGIYFLFDGRELVYVGMGDIYRRVSTHAYERGISFDSYCGVEVPSRALAAQWEAHFIQKLRPRLNVKHNG
jgi:hypothetical protein